MANYYFFSFFIPLFLSQATGIVFILICQVLEVSKPFPDAKCHQSEDNGKVPDFQPAMYFMTSAAVAMAVLLICTFKPQYKRLDMERRKAAMRILNTGSQQRLPTIPSGSGSSSPDE